MTAFISRKDLSSEYFEWDQYPKNIKLAHASAKENIHKCRAFLANLEPTQALQLHLRIAQVWKRQSGGISFEEECALGKELSKRHLDDPFVQRAVFDFMEGKEAELELQPKASICQIAENAVVITCADLFATTFTMYAPPDLPPSAEPYMALACEAMSFTARHIPFCGNYSRPLGKEKEIQISAKLIGDRTAEFQSECKRKGTTEYLLFKKNTLANSFERRIKRAKLCKRTVVGNCTEDATGAFHYLSKKRRPHLKVDIFHIKNGNHAFLVIGRDWKSDPNDIKTWGPNAVVIDVWTRKIYPASQILDFLEDSAGIDSLYQPKLKKFNPDKQSLVLAESNLYNAQDFKAKSPFPLPALEEMLDSVHSLPAHEQATHLLQFIDQSLLSHMLEHDALSSLVSQLRYLLDLPSLDVMELPLFHDLKQVKLAGDPEMFDKAINDSLKFEFGSLDLGFWMTYLTGNPTFIKKGMESKEEPTSTTLWLAALVSLKLGSTDYLRSALSRGALANEDSFSYYLSAMKKTNNPDFLRLFIQAGGTPSRSEIKFLVSSATTTKQLGVLKLFDRKTSTGRWIVHYLKEHVKANPISCELYQEIKCSFPIALN